MNGKRSVKKVIAWSAAVLAALFLIGLAALVIWFPAEKVKTLAERKIGQATGREATIGDVGVSILLGPAVDLEDIEIGPLPEETVPGLVRADHLYLRIRILPLLSGRVEIASLVLDSPELFIEKTGGDLLRPEEAPGEPIESEGEGFTLSILSLSVRNAMIHYIDRAEELEFTAGPAELDLTVGKPSRDNPRQVSGYGRLGGFSSPAMETVSRTAADFLPLELSFGGIATERPGEGLFAFDNIELETVGIELDGGVELAGNAALEGIGADSMSYRVDLAGGAGKLSRYASLIPEREDGSAWLTGLSGSADVEISLDGRAGGEPVYEIAVTLRDAAADVQGLAGRLEKAGGTVALKEETLTVTNLSGSLGDGRVSLGGTVGLGEGNPFDLSLQAALPVDDLPRMAPGALEGWSMSGRLDADLELEGRADNPGGLSARGTVGGQALEIACPEAPSAVRLQNIELNLDGRGLSRSTLGLRGESTSVEIALSADNLPALLFQEDNDPMTASWNLAVSGERLDLTDFTGDRTTPREDAESGEGGLDKFSMPFSLGRGKGSVRVGSLVLLPGVELNDTDIAFTAGGRTVSLERIGGGFFAGTLDGGGTLTLPEQGVPGVDLNLKAGNVQAGELVSPFSTFGSYLSGLLSTDINLSRPAAVGSRFSEDLGGLASFTLEQGQVRGWPALNSLAGLTNIRELEDLRIEDWTGSFRIESGRLVGDDLRINTQVSDMLASGSVGFDGSLDYDLALVLSPELTRRYRGKLPGEIASLLTGGEDRLELNFNLRGTTAEPKVSWDADPVKKRLENKLGEQVDKLVDRLLPSRGKSSADSAAGDSARTDSTGAADLKEGVKGLLRNLLGGGREPK